MSQDLPSSRTSNALECSLAFLCTWFGQPRVALSLIYDPTDPLSVLSGEPNARERAEAYVGRPFEYARPRRIGVRGHRATAVGGGPRNPPRSL